MKKKIFMYVSNKICKRCIHPSFDLKEKLKKKKNNTMFMGKMAQYPFFPNQISSLLFYMGIKKLIPKCIWGVKRSELVNTIWKENKEKKQTIWFIDKLKKVFRQHEFRLDKQVNGSEWRNQKQTHKNDEQSNSFGQKLLPFSSIFCHLVFPYGWHSQNPLGPMSKISFFLLPLESATTLPYQSNMDIFLKLALRYKRKRFTLQAYP